MLRFTSIIFGLTLLALFLISNAGVGDASPNDSQREPILYADTVHINLSAPTENVEAPNRSRDTFLKNVKKLTQTAFHIRNQYMEDIDVEEMIKAGMSGMLADLDRFSVVMEKQSYDNLMESTHGKYQGLGMQIDARDDHIVIVAPIEGTPAYRKGLKAGDVIWKIDSASTSGMNSSDAAKLMRGPAGTSVVLTIKRQGLAELIEFEVERALIELKSVNYSGLVPGTNIGYVRLSRFAEETSRELREAISSLNDQNCESLIFDLRSNGGGLLDQAKETAELFLESGREIVYTKGRDASSERHYRSDRPPLFGIEKPLLILVDAGTASASEIVAGAIQDWDRGIIVGTTTYGKGLVQQIFPIDNEGSLALKLTTAKYYVPSGRCIQKPERQGKKPLDHPVAETDTDTDSLVVAEKEIFYTNGGRVVYGGGGIVPDVEIEGELWQPIEINLERKDIFFDYAIKFVTEHADLKPDFDVTDEMVTDFQSYMEEKEFTYKSALQIALEEMRQSVIEEDKEESFAEALSDMDQIVDAEKLLDFERSAKYIRRAMKREIVRSIAGERGYYEQIALKSDPAVKRAVEILSSPTEYSRLITEGRKKAEL